MPGPDEAPRRSSLARNAGLNFIIQALVSLASVITSIAVARVLGPVEAGAYSLLLFLSTALVALSTAGLPITTTTFVAARRAAGKGAEAEAARRMCVRLGLCTATAAAASLIVVALSGASPSGSSSRAVGLAAAAIPLLAYTTLASAALQGQDRFEVMLRISAVTSAASVLTACTALAMGGQVEGVLLGSLISASLAAVLFRRALGGEAAPARLIQADRRALRRYALPVSVIVIMDVVVWQRSEVVLLSATRAAEEVAYYALAYTLVSRIMALIPGSVSGVLLARFAHDTVTGELDAVFTSSMRWLGIVTAPLMAVGAVFARPLVSTVFGDDYLPMVPVLRVLAVSAGLAAIIAAGSSAMYGAGQQGYLVKVALVIAVLNVAAGVVVIPSQGAEGAAACNALAQGIGIIAGLWYLTRRLALKVPWRALALALAMAALLAAGTAHLVHPLDAQAELAVGVPVTLLLYVLSMLVLGVVTSAEKRSLMGRLRRDPQDLVSG